MTPYYERDGIVIFHADCREVLPTLEPGSVDLVLTDPPYGMNNDCDYTRFTPGPNTDHHANGNAGRWHPQVVSDDEPFDPTPWLAFPRVILWGWNHYAARLPIGTTLVWLKRYDDGFGSFLSDAEVAWMKGGHGVYARRDVSLQGQSRHRHHPTEKPVGMMSWCIGKAGGTGTILDPYMGSGPVGVAAMLAGRPYIGIEIEERYCEIAAKRLSQEVLL
jgi:DNA modification methylase